MLSTFYLDLQEYVHSDKKSIDVITKRYELWKEHHMEWMQKQYEKKQAYIEKYELPRKQFEEQYKEFQQENQAYKKKFEKSAVSKKQASLEKWLNYQTTKIQEFINVANE